MGRKTILNVNHKNLHNLCSMYHSQIEDMTQLSNQNVDTDTEDPIGGSTAA